MGFERFYGIIRAEASQWEPPVYDQTMPIEPPTWIKRIII
jgi:hypothetical protein